MESIATPRLLGYLALAMVIAGNAAGNIFLKLGAASGKDNGFYDLVNWRTATGIACFAFGILAYAWALKHIELHVAQIVVSVQYVAVIALAAMLLGEHVTQSQWIGIALITLGLIVCTQ